MNLRPSSKITAALTLVFLLTAAACENSSRSESPSTGFVAPVAAQELTEDEHIALMEQARSEQMKAQSGAFFEIAGGCRFASSISTSSPAGKVLLTFDDGPDKNLTPFVLDVLKRRKIRATFFVTGAHAAGLQNIIRRAKAEGHLIASHSWNHPDFHTLSSRDQFGQVTSTEVQIRGFMENRRLFRYPFGNSSCETNQLLKSRGYGIVGWHVDTCDWAFNKTGSVTAKQAEICEVKASNMNDFVGHVLDQVRKHRGGIVLMHDIRANTIHQLDKIIEELDRDGFSFTNLDDPAFRNSIR
jgi:peptidoglycan/xylan/chitin deacetylase (PgdA/CDA1 family)